MVWTGESLTCILEESLRLPFLCTLPFRGNIIGPDVILCKGHLIRKQSKQKQGSSTISAEGSRRRDNPSVQPY